MYIVHPLLRSEINSLLFTSDNKSLTVWSDAFKASLIWWSGTYKFNSEQMRENWTYTHSGQNIDKQISKCHQGHIILLVCALIIFTFERNHSVYMLFSKRKRSFPGSCLGSSWSRWTGQLWTVLKTIHLYDMDLLCTMYFFFGRVVCLCSQVQLVLHSPH